VAEEAPKMLTRAHVFLKRGDTGPIDDIGEKDVSGKLVAQGHVQFEHGGERIIARVDQVDKRPAVPTISVVTSSAAC
jgi:hypothetical protein